MYDLDGEEIYYYDFNKKKAVVAIPEFADSESFQFPTDFEPSVHNTQMCKDFLALFTNNSEHQAEQAGKGHANNINYCVFVS